MAILSLSQRRLEPEEMDDPHLPTDQLHGALTGLMRLNRVSNSARIIWAPISRLAHQLQAKRLRVLDIATGAGDVPLALWQRAKNAGLDLEIHGIDFSRRSIAFARRRAADQRSPVTFHCRDALKDNLPPDFDVVMCSLFLHHLTRGDAINLLGRMAASARHLLLVSDLRRNASGLCLAYAASRLLSRSRVVHRDAVQSVRAALTTSELGSMAAEAGLTRYSIVRRWPARMLLCSHKHD